MQNPPSKTLNVLLTKVIAWALPAGRGWWRSSGGQLPPGPAQNPGMSRWEAASEPASLCVPPSPSDPSGPPPQSRSRDLSTSRAPSQFHWNAGKCLALDLKLDIEPVNDSSLFYSLDNLDMTDHSSNHLIDLIIITDRRSKYLFLWRCWHQIKRGFPGREQSSRALFLGRIYLN